MAITKFGEAIGHTNGELPELNSQAPSFVLTGNDMKDITSSQFAGKNVVLNIFPSIDTRTCATSVREFNKRAAQLNNTVVLCVAKDLPFAMRRFCGAEGIENVITASDFRDKGFAKDYGVLFIDGPFEGLLSRAIVIIDPEGNIKYTEHVPLIGQEPDYDAALTSIKQENP